MKSRRMLSLLVGLLLIVLAASALFNLVLLRQSRQYQRFFNGTRLNPLGLDAYPTAATPSAEAEAAGPQRVVFFGDSRAAQWVPPADNAQWQFINRGVNGQTSVQALLRFDYHIPPVALDVLVVQVGVNDLSTLPLFPHDRATIIAACKNNISQIVTRAHEEGATVILTTIFPLGPAPLEQRLFSAVDLPAAVDEVNQHIATLRDEHVFIFDTAAVLADATGRVRPEYQDDFLHINADGYTALNVELLRILAEIGGEP